MDRKARIEENEKLFREVNERVAQMHQGFQTGSDPEWVCECGDESCFEQVELAKDEYERVREDPARFFVSPGHEDTTAGERIVERCDQFIVVEKVGRAREVVTSTDPRKG